MSTTERYLKEVSALERYQKVYRRGIKKSTRRGIKKSTRRGIKKSTRRDIKKVY